MPAKFERVVATVALLHQMQLQILLNIFSVKSNEGIR